MASGKLYCCHLARIGLIFFHQSYSLLIACTVRGNQSYFRIVSGFLGWLKYPVDKHSRPGGKDVDYFRGVPLREKPIIRLTH